MLLGAREAATATHRKHGLNLSIPQNSSNPYDQLGKHREVIVAFLKCFLKRNIQINELNVYEGYMDDRRDLKCNLDIGEDTLGHVEIMVSKWQVHIGVVLSTFISPKSFYGRQTVIFDKIWKRVYVKRRQTHKSNRRPKFRKFGAHVASQLLSHYGEYAVANTMES